MYQNLVIVCEEWRVFRYDFIATEQQGVIEWFTCVRYGWTKWLMSWYVLYMHTYVWQKADTTMYERQDAEWGSHLSLIDG